MEYNYVINYQIGENCNQKPNFYTENGTRRAQVKLRDKLRPFQVQHPTFIPSAMNNIGIFGHENGEERLYHHSKDPNAWTNIARDLQYQAIKDTLKAFVPTK